MSFADIYRGRKVLITGHTGFKGSWLTAWLLSLGAKVCGMSKGIPTNPSLFEMAQLEKDIEHNIVDVRDYEAVERVLMAFQPDFVFHLAAQPIVSVSYQDPLETITTNVTGTACVLQALRQVTWPCAAVFITSDKCYENVEWVWGYRETDHMGGKDVYSGSKGAAELIFHSCFRSFFKGKNTPVRLATARAGNVIGGGDWALDRIIVDCVQAWRQGQPVRIRSPRATRPWQHVLEPLSGYLCLGQDLYSQNTLDGESFNFGPRAEQNRTVLELLQDIGHIWGLVDTASIYEVVDNIPFNEAGILKLNCDKALFHLKWEPNLSYQECVTTTGEWYRRVLKENEDARALTLQQIDAYHRLAQERQRVWTNR